MRPRSRTSAIVLVASLTGCALALQDDYEAVPAAGTGPSGDAGLVPGSDAGGDATADRDPADSPGDAPDSPIVDAGYDATDAAVLHAAYALHYDGTSYTDMGAFQVPGDFTIEAWIYPDDLGGEQYAIAEDRSHQTDGQLRFGIIDTGELFFIMSDDQGNTHGLGSSGTYPLQSPSAMPVNKWTHIAVTKAGASFNLLVNGASVKTTTATASFNYGTATPAPLRIAARVAQSGTGPDGNFKGAIDEVRFWNTARSVQQINDNKARAIVPADAQYGQLVSFWRFNEGQGTTTADEKNKSPGTLVSGPMWITSTAY